MHGHITVNGRRLDIPSYLVKVGDVIRVKNRKKSLHAVQANLAARPGSCGRPFDAFVEISCFAR